MHFHPLHSVRPARIILLLVLLANVFNSHSQEIDSLLRLLPKQKNDTNKVLLLNNIVRSYTFGDISQQPKYIAQMLELSKKLHYNYGEGISYLSYADYYIRTRQNDLALKNIQLGRDTYRKSNYRNGLAIVDNMFGRYYASVGQYESALSSYQRALDYYEKTGNKNLQAGTLGIIAQMFFDLKRYDESEKYYLPIPAIYHKIGNKRAESVSLINIGTLYFVQEKYAESEKCYDRAMTLQKELNDPSTIAQIQQSKGVFYARRGDFGQSLKILGKAYTTFSELKDTLNMGYTLIYRADTYLRQKHYRLGIETMDKAIQLARLGRADSSLISDFYQQYYLIHKAAGDYRSALNYYEKTMENRSDLFSTETADKISELKEKYETDKKEQENRVLKSNNAIQALELRNSRYIVLAVVVLLGLVMLIAILIARNNRFRVRTRTAQLQQQLLVSQMNPHFIFNSLNSIQNYIYKQDSLTASSYLNRFADLMRMILNFSRKEMITLDEEVQMLENYLSLQQLRFGEKLDYTIEISDDIEPEFMDIPPMLAQPFIENALEHGLFRGPDGGGKVTIAFRRQDDHLVFTIRDNGIGLKRSQNEKANSALAGHVSLATIITQERIETWNRSTRSNARFEIIDLVDKDPALHGVEVVFMLPYTTLS